MAWRIACALVVPAIPGHEVTKEAFAFPKLEYVNCKSEWVWCVLYNIPPAAPGSASTESGSFPGRSSRSRSNRKHISLCPNQGKPWGSYQAACFHVNRSSVSAHVIAVNTSDLKAVCRSVGQPGNNLRRGGGGVCPCCERTVCRAFQLISVLRRGRQVSKKELFSERQGNLARLPMEPPQDLPGVGGRERWRLGPEGSSRSRETFQPHSRH